MAREVPSISGGVGGGGGGITVEWWCTLTRPTLARRGARARARRLGLRRRLLRDERARCRQRQRLFVLLAARALELLPALQRDWRFRV